MYDMKLSFFVVDGFGFRIVNYHRFGLTFSILLLLTTGQRNTKEQIHNNPPDNSTSNHHQQTLQIHINLAIPYHGGALEENHIENTELKVEHELKQHHRLRDKHIILHLTIHYYQTGYQLYSSKAVQLYGVVVVQVRMDDTFDERTDAVDECHDQDGTLHPVHIRHEVLTKLTVEVFIEEVTTDTPCCHKIKKQNEPNQIQLISEAKTKHRLEVPKGKKGKVLNITFNEHLI